MATNHRFEIAHWFTSNEITTTKIMSAFPPYESLAYIFWYIIIKKKELFKTLKKELF